MVRTACTHAPLCCSYLYGNTFLASKERWRYLRSVIDLERKIMAEIPEHLLKRAQEAKERAASGGDSSPSEAPTAESKIPDELLERTAAAGSRPSAVATKEAATEVTSPQPPAPSTTGPAGNTQRLLAVVKSGSIQDVKLKPVDKVHVWPHLLVVEFVAALAVTAFCVVFSIFVNAPLLELANFIKLRIHLKLLGIFWGFKNF